MQLQYARSGGADSSDSAGGSRPHRLFGALHSCARVLLFTVCSLEIASFFVVVSVSDVTANCSQSAIAINNARAQQREQGEDMQQEYSDLQDEQGMLMQSIQQKQQFTAELNQRTARANVRISEICCLIMSECLCRRSSSLCSTKHTTRFFNPVTAYFRFARTKQPCSLRSRRVCSCKSARSS